MRNHILITLEISQRKENQLSGWTLAKNSETLTWARQIGIQLNLQDSRKIPLPITAVPNHPLTTALNRTYSKKQRQAFYMVQTIADHTINVQSSIPTHQQIITLTIVATPITIVILTQISRLTSKCQHLHLAITIDIPGIIKIHVICDRNIVLS